MSQATASTDPFYLTFLAQAGQILAKTLNPQDVADEVARLFVPLLADGAAVDLLDGGRWTRAAAHHVDEHEGRKLAAHGLEQIINDKPSLVAQLLNTGEPVAIGAGPQQKFSPELECLVGDILGLSLPQPNMTAISVPLIAGDQILGLITTSCDRVVRRGAEDNFTLTTELARRAAVAVANARLFAEVQSARAAAETARQRSLWLSGVADALSTTVRLGDILRETGTAALAQLCSCWVLSVYDSYGKVHVYADHIDPALKPQMAALVKQPNVMTQLLQRSGLHDVQPARPLKFTAPPLAEGITDLALSTSKSKLQHEPSLAHASTSLSEDFFEQVKPRYIFALPLFVRHEPRGHAFFLRGLNEPLFDENDRSLAEELLKRAATAIDKTWLFEELEVAVRVRDEFLSIASHELRTPLTALELQLDNLRRLVTKCPELPSGNRFCEKLNRASKQTERLAKLIDNLLDVSRISGGRFNLDPASMHLERLCIDVVERFRQDAAGQKPDIELNIIGHARGLWDELRLDQVLTNLLSNAVKYGANKPIVVTLNARAHDVVISVQDRGIGIEEAALARIFDRFERAVSAREFGGLGLGLFISRQIIEAHGGRISAQSKSGEGSLFEVILPYKTPASARYRASTEDNHLVEKIL